MKTFILMVQKIMNRVAAATVTKSHIFGKRLPKYASIFTAEPRAIHLAFM